MRYLQLLIILFFTNNFILACDYTVDLHDTFIFNDGWNGNTATISVNGVDVLSNITILNGSADAQFTFSANAGDNITITYFSTGLSQNENEITVTSDDLGVVIFSDGLAGASPSGGVFTVGNDCGIDVPANDEPCQAVNLPVNNDCVNTVGSTVGATSSAATAPTCGSFTTQSDVWFETTVADNGYLTITLDDGSINANMAIYVGTDCANLIELACTTTDEYFALTLDAGDQVWIRVWDENNGEGSFEICATDVGLLMVDPTIFTPSELIEDVLITGCLQAMNVQYDGDPSAIGYFKGGEAFGMSSGMILATASVVDLTGQGPNTVFGQETGNAAVEADLSALSILNGGAADMHDEVILEFDFIPSSDTTEFDFVFASSEYPTYEFSQYNDVFAFFVSGPGILGTYTDDAINVALVPGTPDPITISTVNGTTNQAYFAGYTSGDPIPNFNAGGYTIPITAVMAGLTPCETYHIKFCIADAGDGSLNSYVFFEESSFSSGGDVAMNNVSPVGQVNDIYEGCENYYVFNRLDTSAIALLDTVNILLDIGGTAIEGADYTNIPDTLFILPGNQTDTLFYTALFDNVVEGTEYIVFSLLNGCPCSIVSTDDTIWIYNNYPTNAVLDNYHLICETDSVELVCDVNPDVDPILINYNWANTSETTSSIWVQPDATTTYILSVTNVCQTDDILSSTVNVVPIIDPNFILSKDTACVGEPVVFTFTGSATNFAQYEWTFNGGTPDVDVGQAPQVSTWSTTGNKTIDLHINDQGCLNDTTFQIYIKEYNNMSLTTDASNLNCFDVCDGIGSVTANSGVAPFTYLWEDGRINQNIDELCPGTFDVTVSDAYGCKDTTHIVVTAPTEMTYTFETQVASCHSYDDGWASVTASGGTPPYSYNWSDNNHTANNVDLFADTYSVTISDDMGCTKIESHIVVAQPDAVITSIYGEDYVGDELWICMGQNTTIHSSATGGVGPYTFLWNSGEETPQISVNPQQTTVYSTRATDNNGCLGLVQEITVNVYDPISFEFSATPNEICIGENVNVEIIPQGGNGEYIYHIESSVGTNLVSESFVISPEQTRLFEIIVSDNCNSPIAKDTFSIVVNHPPLPSFNADKNAGCIPLEVNFVENSPEDNNSYLWEFTDDENNSNVSMSKNTDYVFAETGAYHVKLRVTSEKGCTSELLKNNYIIVFPSPVADFLPEPSTASVIKPLIFFNNQSTDADHYIWSFGDADSSQHASPEHLYPKRVSTYQVNLVASNRWGCKDSSFQNVQILDEVTLFFPTAFTPDGDYINESFLVKGNGISDEGFSMIIYDRWGLEVFNSTNRTEAWDGRAKNGTYVKPGTYSWIVKYTDVYSVPHEESGHINVLK